jgi:hypothetical protein
MKTLNSLAYASALEIGVVFFLMLAVASDSASAETFRHGGSTSTIEQRGGGTSRSTVSRFQDAQRVVTRDGNSTDITLQDGGDAYAAGGGVRSPEWVRERLGWQDLQERFSRGFGAASGPAMSNPDDVVQQRFDRMRGRLEP